MAGRTPGGGRPARGDAGGPVQIAVDRLRSALWPLPALLVTIAAVGGMLLPTREDGADRASSWVFGGGPDAARSVCSVIAGSMITVTALTFSLTVVSLQLFSSQFTPRLLRSFASDRTVQVTLGTLLATFTFALAVLRTIRSADEGAPFVPRVSVTVTLVLTLLSVALLVHFIAHLVRQLRVETVMSSVADDARSTIRRVLRPAGPPAPAVPVSPADAVALAASRTGFLLRVDHAGLVAAAEAGGAVVLLHPTPGDWTVAGTPLATAWPAEPGGALEERTLTDRVNAALTFGHERTGVADIAIGVRQLVDIAAKALSPGINDPTTAVHALGHLSALLCELLDRDLSPRVARGRDGRVRLVAPQRRFPELLALAVDQPRRYGAAEPAVLSRLLQLLREVGWGARTEEQDTAVRRELRLLRAAADRAATDEDGRWDLDVRAGDVEDALDGRWRIR